MKPRYDDASDYLFEIEDRAEPAPAAAPAPPAGKPPYCPRCGRPVLRVEQRPTSLIYVHQALQNGHIFGCTESTLGRNGGPQ